MAHIVQADQHHDIFMERRLRISPLPFELQLFQSGKDAQSWLREQVARLGAKPAA